MTSISDREFIVILVIYIIAYKLLTTVTQSEIDILRENRKTFNETKNKNNIYFKIKNIFKFLYSVIALILNATARILMLSSFIKICYIFIKQK